MAKTQARKLSQEEVLDQAARLIAGTINPDKMGLAPEELDIELFVQYFKEKASELLCSQENLLLSIGKYINTTNSGIYSNDVQIILNSIEQKMHTQFHFYHGILIWLCNNEIYANWLPH